MRNTPASIKLWALAVVIAFGSLVSPQSTHAAGLDPSSRIISSPRVTEGQVVRYLVPKYNGAYTGADIRWIVGRDFDVSVKAGVDPLVVIAQMDHETAHLSSYWSQRPRRNPAGIGVTGAPGAGVSAPATACAALPTPTARSDIRPLPLTNAHPYEPSRA